MERGDGKPLPRRDQGVTLIELMFALAVIGIVLMAVMSATLFATRDREDQRERSIAKEAVADKLEEIRQQEFADILTLYGSPNNTFNVEGLGYLENTAGNKQGLGTITIDSSNAELYDIRVTVTWDSTHGTVEYSLQSLYTR